jgi:hypothetical protein
MPDQNVTVELAYHDMNAGAHPAFIYTLVAAIVCATHQTVPVRAELCIVVVYPPVRHFKSCTQKALVEY